MNNLLPFYKNKFKNVFTGFPVGISHNFAYLRVPLLVSSRERDSLYPHDSRKNLKNRLCDIIHN
jgi:hypothetical protein